MAEESRKSEVGPSDRPERPESPGGSVGAGASPGADRDIAARIEPKPFPSEAAGTLVGRRYEITEFLGAGRRGRVYLARDRLTDATVALKRFRTDTPTLRQAAELAMRAAEAVAGLKHDSIVRVFDLGEDPAGPFVVSEYVDGPDAAKLVSSQGAMSLRQAARVVETIGQAVSYAHERNLFHGSIRGSNILFADGRRPLLCDFALGEVEAPDVPKARRQDVKSLVRTLCQLLTGVSSGSLEVRDLPEVIQPAVRASLGGGVTTAQPTIDSFLRELRATELDLVHSPLEEESEALGRGRKAELSGSFEAMREAGQTALEANSESAEAMVLLRRADQLETERDELITAFRAEETEHNYARALELLTKLHRRFPADFKAQKLGSKREMLAELTRLSGIAHQLVQSGHVAASLETWRRITELSPSDEHARHMARQAARARMKRRFMTLSGVAVVLLAVGGAGGYFAWQEGYLEGVPYLPTSAKGVQAAAGGGMAGAGDRDPLTPDTGGEPGSGAVLPALTDDDGEERAHQDDALSDWESADAASGSAGDGNADGEAGAGTAPVVPEVDPAIEAARLAEMERERELKRSAAQAKRDALDALTHAERAGAAGLAPDEFRYAQRELAHAETLLLDKSLEASAAGFERARGGFVSASAIAAGEVARVRSLFGEKKFRAAAKEIERLEPLAGEAIAERLRQEMDRAREVVLDLGGGETMAMRYVEPGVFMMGAAEDDGLRRFGEDRRQVRVERGFWIGKTELTRGQVAAIRGLDAPDRPDVPATGMTLSEAERLAETLGTQFGGTFDVPTEAQWEYAARADRDSVSDEGWSILESGGSAQEPGSFGANPWGLVDMMGNVAELVRVPGEELGEGVAMTRGGSYLSTRAALRVTARHELVPIDHADARVGVRLVWTGAAGE